jgi:hypothetical protein
VWSGALQCRVLVLVRQVPFQVCSCSSQSPRTVLKASKARIAAAAQKSPNRICYVIVINVKVLALFRFLLTDGATAALSL